MGALWLSTKCGLAVQLTAVTFSPESLRLYFPDAGVFPFMTQENCDLCNLRLHPEGVNGDCNMGLCINVLLSLALALASLLTNELARVVENSANHSASKS